MTDPQWRYVDLRHVPYFVDTSLEAGLRWVRFEPNNEATWTEVSRQAANFLLGLWRMNCLTGAGPEEAFFVRCDRSTMTQDDLTAGRLICEVGIAPVRPAEFVVTRIAVAAGTAD